MLGTDAAAIARLRASLAVSRADRCHRILAVQAFLALSTGDDLLDCGFRLSHDHLLEQALVVLDGEWEVDAAVLRLQGFLGIR